MTDPTSTDRKAARELALFIHPDFPESAMESPWVQGIAAILARCYAEERERVRWAIEHFMDDHPEGLACRECDRQRAALPEWAKGKP